MRIQAVAVFCGSKNGNNPLFARHAAELGKLLAAHDLTLVYGGGNSGLMGIIADAVLEAEGRVIGVLPEVLLEWERKHERLTEIAVVPDMHTRKKMMYERCDAAIILPGGFGTLDELFEMLTWNQLKIHNKKIIIVNSGGFFDHLVAHLRQLEKEKFLYDTLEDRITVCSTPEEAIATCSYAGKNQIPPV